MNRCFFENNVELYNTTTLAICKGLNAAIFSLIAKIALEIHICLDNLNIAWKVKNIKKCYSHVVLNKFEFAVKNWLYTGKKNYKIDFKLNRDWK